MRSSSPSKPDCWLQPRRLGAHGGPKSGDVLAQSPIDQERAVAQPVDAWGHRPGDERIGARGRIAEHQLAWPHQGLTRIAVEPGIGNIRRIEVAVGDVIVRGGAGAAADAGLRDAVVESEMLVAAIVGAHVARLDRDLGAVSGELAREFSRGVARGLAVVRRDHHHGVELFTRLADHPVLRRARIGRIGRIAEQGGALRQATEKGRAVDLRHGRRELAEALRGETDCHQRRPVRFLELTGLVAAMVAAILQRDGAVRDRTAAHHLADCALRRQESSTVLRKAQIDERLVRLEEARHRDALDVVELEHGLCRRCRCRRRRRGWDFRGCLGHADHFTGMCG